MGGAPVAAAPAAAGAVADGVLGPSGWRGGRMNTGERTIQRGHGCRPDRFQSFTYEMAAIPEHLIGPRQ